MKPQILSNFFTKGMQKDLEPSMVPNDSYIEAWNAVMQGDEHYNLTNEHSNALAQDFGGKVVGYVRIPDRNSTVFFVKDGSSTLYLFNHETNAKTKIISDSDYGCNWNFDECEFILAETKRMQPCNELILYFSSNCFYYRVNIDEVLDPIRSSDLTCNDFNLFNCICGPKNQPFVLEGAGKDLLAGAYQFSVQLQDRDGNTTNWFLVGEPVYLGSENNNPNEASEDGVALRIEGLDKNYTRVNVAVVRTNGGATTSFLITSRTYNSDAVTVEYTSQEQNLEDIPLEEILIKKKTYIKGKRLFQKDGRLFLYQLQQENNLNYQRVANNIVTKYQTYKVPATEAWRFKSLMRDEVYAFGIVWKYCDGTYSPVFHIPNNVAKPGGNVESCTDCDVPSWLANSSATRTSTFCFESTNNDIDDFCYCPQNQVCDEDCNVIVTVDDPVDPEEPEDVCVVFYFNFDILDQSSICDTAEFTYNINFTSNGNLYTESGTVVGRSPNGIVITIPAGSEGYSINDVSFLLSSVPPGCEPIGFSYTSSEVPCDFDPGGGAPNFGSIQSLSSPLQNNNVCPPGGCGTGSGVCGPGGCFGGSCVGGGCRGGAGAGLSGTGMIPYNSDIRPTAVHQKAYQRENCSDASQFISDECDILSCSDCVSNGASNDAPILFKGLINTVEYLRDLLRKDDDVRSSPTLNTSSSLGDAVGKLCGTVENIERPARKAAELEKGTLVPPILNSLLTGGTEKDPCEGSPIFADDGCTIIGYRPALIAEGNMGYWESQELYPLDKDCDGEYLYGNLAGTPIRHHKTPGVSTEPLFRSTQTGVESFMEPDNLPYKDTDVYLLGASFGNIVFPTNPPKPLCQSEPYKIVMAKREGNNKSIIGKGLLTHTFEGETYGKTYAVPKHGVNSFEYVDRHIENGEDENHRGEPWTRQIFGFHSLDVNNFQPFLNPDYIKLEGETFGAGWKYGSYAPGADPVAATENKLDRRGTRQAINLNRWSPPSVSNTNFCVTGITYAEQNSIVAKAPGIDFPIMNKYRERAVYLQTDRDLPAFEHYRVSGKSGADPYIDYSFVGDGVDHSQPITVGVAHVVSLKRYSKSQYGNIESLTYVATGLSSTGSKVEGTLGDVHVGQYSFKRSGYVSNKVGDILNEQFAGINGGRITAPNFLGVSPRTVCMPPNRNGINLEEDLGMYDTKELPETGDFTHPKNMANLHPTRVWQEVYNEGIVAPESDIYYPRTLTTLIHFWQESEINPKFRGGGDEQLREIFYPLLKSSELDSDLPNPGGVADSGWLNDFHQRQKRMSKAQMAMRTAIRTLVKVGLPGIFAAMIAGTETGLELTSTLAVSPLLVAGWLVLDRYIFSVRNLNKLLGIDECLTDEQGGQQKEDIQGFKDNWHRYSLDYSHLNDVNVLLNMPANYNTCDCSDCIQQPNNEIYYSNKQALDSPVDAYRNFDANNYLNIPAHAGVLQNLFVRQNRFYAHTTDAIWIMQYSNTAVPSDNGIIILGQGDLLSDPQEVLEAVIEGHAGIQHPKTAINTKYGYIFQDEEARKLYVFGDGGLIELNALDSGMYNWMRTHLPQCSTTCSEIPFSFGVDYENSRILFSNNGWTISYDLIRKRFVSFHSYRPDFYIFDRYNFYSIKNDEIWKHNQEGYQEFYGEIGEFSVEFAANQAQNRSIFPFVFENSLVDSEANALGTSPVRNLPITFDKMVGWNTHQTTGMLDIDTRDAGGPTDLLDEITTKDGIVSWMRRGISWRYNNIKNYLQNESEPIWLEDKCTNTKTLNTSNIDLSQDWDKTHKMEDRFITFKYIFSRLQNVQLILKSVVTRIKNTEEHSNG
jgi:hypothetical protein